MRPGRPRCPRRIEREPEITYFKPRGIPLSHLEVVTISLEELESVRLIDIEGMEQEQAARSMGISRRAFWEDLQRARRSIADALVVGKAIQIEGGNYRVERKRIRSCQNCHNEWEGPFRPDEPQKCPKCGGVNIDGNIENESHPALDGGHSGKCKCEKRRGQKD